MCIDYDHSRNLHTVEGARAALPKFFPDAMPASLLDIGCGRGTWLRAATECGVTDIFGVDGVEIPREQLLFPPERFICRDLARPLDLGRRFEAVFCLEVAEHLQPAASSTLIDTLTSHADTIVFSAACPWQPGQYHVNCQWPEYWQQLFNSRGFVCEDSLRWRVWSLQQIEPWYRQNVFLARRFPDRAGSERRIPPVVHPDLMGPSPEDRIRQVEQGCMPAGWYFSVVASGISAKLRRRLARIKRA